MFDNVILPNRITPSPIDQVVFEIRYNSSFSEKKILSILDSCAAELFTSSPIESQLINVPLELREKDPSLKYKPLKIYVKDNVSFSFSSHSLIFQCFNPYPGWETWYSFIMSIINNLLKIPEFTKIKIERFGLRYFDVLEGNVIENLNLNLIVANNNLCAEPISFQTELAESDKKVLLKVNNNISFEFTPGNNKQGTLIDVDCIKLEKKPFQEIQNATIDFLQDAHKITKKYFFGLLKDNYLKQLNPEY